MRIHILGLVAAAVLTASAVEAKNITPSPMLDFVRPAYSVPVTSDAFGEGKAVLGKLAAEERSRLLKDGWVITESTEQSEAAKGMKVGYVVVNVPRAEVWKYINQPGEWYKFLPRLEKTKRVRQAENYELAWYRMKVSLVTLEFQAEHRYWPEVSRMAWTLDPAYNNDLRRQDGYYNIYALDDHTTLVEYGTRVETGPMVPSFVQSYLLETAFPDVLVAMKKFMDSGGTYRK